MEVRVGRCSEVEERGGGVVGGRLQRGFKQARDKDPEVMGSL